MKAPVSRLLPLVVIPALVAAACDQTAPTVLSIEWSSDRPWMHDTLTVEFDEPISMLESYRGFQLFDGSGAPLDARRGASVDHTRVTIRLLAGQPADATLTLRLDDSIVDEAGNAISPTTRSWSFDDWTTELSWAFNDDQPGPPTIFTWPESELRMLSTVGFGVTHASRASIDDSRDLAIMLRGDRGWEELIAGPVEGVLGEPVLVPLGEDGVLVASPGDEAPRLEVSSQTSPWWDRAGAPALQGDPRITLDDAVTVVATTTSTRVQVAAFHADAEDWELLEDLETIGTVADTQVAVLGGGGFVVAVRDLGRLRLFERRGDAWAEWPALTVPEIEGTLALATRDGRAYLGWTEIIEGVPTARVAEVSAGAFTPLAALSSGLGGSRAPAIAVDLDGALVCSWTEVIDGDGVGHVDRWVDGQWTRIGDPWITADPTTVTSMSLWMEQAPIVSWRDQQRIGVALYNGQFD